MITRKIKRTLVASRWATPLLWLLRLTIATRLAANCLWTLFVWLFKSKEYTNFTYEITDRSRRHLARLVAAVTGETDVLLVEEIQRELLGDEELASHIRSASTASPRRGAVDRKAEYGRRITWYALVRLTKPRVVVETGVDKGLGTLVLAAALRRNAAEGAGGRVIALDVNPTAGHLIGPPYSDFTDLWVGNSLSYLEGLRATVDIFIHDSDHAYKHEMDELEAVLPHMSASGFLLSDSAADSDALDDFCRAHRMDFAYAAEQVKNHWMSAQGVGIGSCASAS